jgi:hypothetical protein
MNNKHKVRVRARPPHEFADLSEVNESDEPLLPSPTGREEGPHDGDPISDFDDEVLSHPVGGRPMSEVTGGPESGTPDETEDGLNPLEEAVRDNAETPRRRERL